MKIINSRKTYLILLLLFTAISFFECSTYSTMMDANTLPPKEMTIIGFGGYSYTKDEHVHEIHPMIIDDDNGYSDSGIIYKFRNNMGFSFLLRAGLLSRIDIGFKLMNVASVEFDIKYNFLRESKYLPACAIDLGYGYGTLYNRAYSAIHIPDFYRGHRPFVQLLSHKSITEDLLFILGYKHIFSQSIDNSNQHWLKSNINFETISTGVKYSLGQKKESKKAYIIFEVDYFLNLNKAKFLQEGYHLPNEIAPKLRQFIAHKRFDFLFGIGGYF